MHRTAGRCGGRAAPQRSAPRRGTGRGTHRPGTGTAAAGLLRPRPKRLAAGHPRPDPRRDDATADPTSAAAACRPAPACPHCRCCQARRPCRCAAAASFMGIRLFRMPLPGSRAAPRRSTHQRHLLQSPTRCRAVKAGVTARSNSTRALLTLSALAFGMSQGKRTWQMDMPRHLRARRMHSTGSARQRTSCHHTCRWCAGKSSPTSNPVIVVHGWHADGACISLQATLSGYLELVRQHTTAQLCSTLWASFHCPTRKVCSLRSRVIRHGAASWPN